MAALVFMSADTSDPKQSRPGGLSKDLEGVGVEIFFLFFFLNSPS